MAPLVCSLFNPSLQNGECRTRECTWSVCVYVCKDVRRCIFVFSFLASRLHYHPRWFNHLFLSHSSKYYIFFSLSPYFCSCWPIIGRGCVNLTINQTHNKFVGRCFSLPFILFFFAQNLYGDKKNIISWISFSKNNIYIYTHIYERLTGSNFSCPYTCLHTI